MDEVDHQIRGRIESALSEAIGDIRSAVNGGREAAIQRYDAEVAAAEGILER